MKVITSLNENFRVVRDPSGAQWMIQRIQRAKQGPKFTWIDVAYCRTKGGLIFRAKGIIEFDAGQKITPDGMAAMQALPEFCS